ELDLHPTHDEGEARRLGLRLREQRMQVGGEQAQTVGAAALHEAQAIGVIDDAGEIRVLVIDADLHDMAAVADRAVERGRIRASSSPPPNSLSCAGSRVGSARPRWRKACEGRSRPRGVRCRNPHWIRNGWMMSSMA